MDRSRVAEFVRRPSTAAAILLVLYVLLSFVVAPGGSLGTDTGAKVATLDHMVETDSWRPDVGYWAEEWDPDGDYHPLFDTRRTSEGEWVNVTTLPMLLAARPLYAVGGYRLALILPMLGAVVAALACRDLAGRLGGPDAATRAFWAVGVASPMAVYALDLWEHSLGAGLMVGGAALLVRVVQESRLLYAVVAGVLFGVSATMRTETFVVTFVAVGFCGLWLLAQRRVRTAIATGGLSIAGFAAPWLANAWLERSLGGNARSERLSSTASAGASTAAAGSELVAELSARAWEAGLTWFGLPGLERLPSIVSGMVFVGLVFAASALARRGDADRAKIALALGLAVFATTLIAAGPSFVRGALVASPLALLGFLWGERGEHRYVLVVALVATAVTWNFQYLGGAGPQWGGRYLLAPTLLLTTLGVVHLPRVPRLVGSALVGTALVVTTFGVVWLSVRTHRVEAFFDDLTSRSEEVVISTNGFLVREAGAAADDRRYLSLGRGADLEGAVDVVRAAGVDTFAVLAPTPELPPVDARLIATEQVEFIDAPFWYFRFELDG